MSDEETRREPAPEEQNSRPREGNAIYLQFRIGEQVWVAGETHDTKEVPCAACIGVGEVSLHDGKMYECPSCRGCKTEMVHSPSYWKPIGPCTVQRIRIEEDLDSLEITYVVEADDEKRDRWVPAGQVFEGADAAQAFAGYKNSTKGEGGGE